MNKMIEMIAKRIVDGYYDISFDYSKHNGQGWGPVITLDPKMPIHKFYKNHPLNDLKDE